MEDCKSPVRVALPVWLWLWLYSLDIIVLQDCGQNQPYAVFVCLLSCCLCPSLLSAAPLDPPPPATRLL